MVKLSQEDYIHKKKLEYNTGFFSDFFGVTKVIPEMQIKSDEKEDIIIIEKRW